MKDWSAMLRHYSTVFWFLALVVAPIQPVLGLTVAVFGGSGFIGRRVCRTLVESVSCDSVISISRSGKPPSYYCNDGTWSNSVDWKSLDLDKEWQTVQLPPIDVAISCIGNVQPRQEWTQMFGLSFDDDKLFYENGVLNQRVIDLSKEAGASRFAFVSVSYETAKCLEGPIEGYLNGKRLAEARACDSFGEENTVLVGPSLVYGGKRFPLLGKFYLSLVESPPARAYVAGNDFLRSLSSAPIEDWLEKMIFSSPVEVEKVARVLCAGGLGLIDRGMVGARRQDFYDQNGKSIIYPNALCIDGTVEIERMDYLVASTLGVDSTRLESASSTSTDSSEPRFEGALIGKRPYLYPLPVVFLFLTIFWSISTQQVVQVTSL
jgi:hypothetical protein